MAELIKPWESGGSLSVTYDGDGDGSAVFSSDQYEGIDREQSVIFRDAGKSIAVEKNVRQEGIRQRFVTSDGKVFVVTNGRFGVLKEGGVVPPTPAETYIPLTYIEATGEQYFNLGYVVKETDIIEMFYRNPFTEEADKFYFGITDGSVAVWVDIYNNTGYLRFGQTSSTVERGGKLRDGALLRIQKASFEVNNVKVLTLAYAGMPSLPLVMFANRNANGVAYGHSDVRCRWWKVTDADGNVTIDLRPMKRNDGAIGLLDKVSGKFFVSESDTSFVAGDEINITDEYQLIDYVTFDADKLYDAGHINSDDSVICQFVSDRTGQYVYGAISSPHTATISLYTGSSNWRWGSTYLSRTTNNNILYTTEQTNGSVMLDYQKASRSESSAFTTAYSMPLGGYVSASGTYTPSFKGKVYHFAIKNGDALLKDWWPCRRKNDGVEGFWDNISKTFVEPII